MWGLVIICSMVWGVLELNRRRHEKRRLKYREFIWDDNGDYVPNPDYVPYEEKPNIIIEFIKAKYHRYCPKIDWKNE